MNFTRRMFTAPMRALIRKELLEVWRDRRALGLALAFAILFPGLIAAMIMFALKSQGEKTFRVALIGGENVPVLEQQLSKGSFQLDSLSESDPASLLNNNYDAVVKIADGFADDYRNFRSPKVYLYVDGSNRFSGRGATHVQKNLGELQQLIVQQRLVARGVAVQLMAPWQVQVRDVSTPSSRSTWIFSSIPMLLIMTLFVGCLSSSIDTSAGERERMSLEVLLQQPVEAWQIVLGKVIAVSSISWFASILALTSLMVVFPFLPLAEMGIKHATTVWGAVTIALALLPLALLIAVLQILLALRSQSFKDAQTQLSILQFLPVTLLFILDMSAIELKGPLWQLVPLVAQQQWFKVLLVGDSISVAWVIAGSLVSLLLVVGCILGGARALQRESLLGAT
ncbi:ABC transporter permease [Microbulbifer sp. OS29]|uniref:ABC transporter permease n=1 Tax=Microbulbifer okhotskensis TaxID=2926617 RepID=A0A9X2ERB7_9GAMM|nr:ABC transporter permease [Microbulbifer okhotskensis]MCO1334313.1 ABC transporter permease [Microbulbifer okhotskensis]